MYPALAGIVLAAALTTEPKGDSVTASISLASGALRENRLADAERFLNQACPQARVGPAQTSCFYLESLFQKKKGNYAEAERLAHEALSSWSGEPNGDNSTYMRLILGLGDIQRCSENWAAARSTFESALAFERARKEPHIPVEPQILSRIASVISQDGDYEQAKRLLTAAISKLKDAGTPGELAFALSNRGLIFASTGEYQRAEADFREGIRLAANAVGEDDPETAPYLGNLAFALLQQGKFSQAELLLVRARAMLEKSGPGGERALIQILAQLSAVYSAEANFAKAEECGIAALRKIEKTFGPDGQDAAMMRVSLAAVYLKENKLTLAEELLPGAIESERRLVKNRRLLCEGVYRMAELRAREKRWTEADALFREAISITEEMFGPEHPQVAALKKEYAPVLKQARLIAGKGFR